jgi:hypothetical protein
MIRAAAVLPHKLAQALANFVGRGYRVRRAGGRNLQPGEVRATESGIEWCALDEAPPQPREEAA